MSTHDPGSLDGPTQVSGECGDEPTNATATVPAPYMQTGVVGEGGMGRVLLVRDTDLDRLAAFKVLRGTLAHDDGARARFDREACLTSQLDHPGIPAVLGRGTLADGRPYYVMRLVRGTPLDRALDQDLPAISSVRSRVDVVRRVAEIVAYAHGEGVLHRDIKPGNIILGAFGEVVLLDWGLALRESELAERTTLHDTIGTPAWMSPERLRGASADRPADVYALGALLHLALKGTPPVPVHANVVTAMRLSAQVTQPPGPAVLGRLTLDAMHVDPDRRPSAQTVVDTLQDWLVGARLATRVARHRAEAEAHFTQATDLTARAQDLEAQAAELLDAVAPWADEAKKVPAWRAQDEAREVRRVALRHSEAAVQSLHVALALDPHDPPSRSLLVQHHRRRASEAARRGDLKAVSDHRAQLRVWSEEGGDPWLSGTVRLDLGWVPAGVEVARIPLVRRLRRFWPDPARPLGVGPLDAAETDEGPGLLELSAPGHATVRHPVLAEPGRSWPKPPPPGRTLTAPPAADSVPDGAVLVPSRWLSVDADPLALDPLTPIEVWLDAFLIARQPVTHARYLAFLDALVGRYGHARAQVHAPRWDGGAEADRPLYRFQDGRYHLDPDQPLTRSPDQPVVLVDWHDAMAFAAFEADRTGIPWRLPHQLEWLRAAGADLGWAFPFGPDDDPAWYCMQSSHAQAPTSASVHDFPVDESPFGVRHLAGNVRDWCLDSYRRQGPTRGAVIEPRVPEGDGLRTIRGGAWTSSSAFCRIQSRFAGPPTQRMSALGFRLAASLR